MQSREQIFEQLKAMLVDLFETDPSKIVPNARLREDLDIDSIDAIDLLLELKKKTGRKLPPDAFKSVRTVDDVVNAVYSLLSS